VCSPSDVVLDAFAPGIIGLLIKGMLAPSSSSASRWGSSSPEMLRVEVFSGATPP
jgi:hypothetical protein